MTLTIVACATASRWPVPVDGYTVRLAGPPEPDDVVPPQVEASADRAAAALRATFPDWLWQWARTSGVLDLATYAGPVSWWWYSPISEMSPLRSPLIRDLYWLLLLRDLVEAHHVDRLVWIGDDPALADIVRRMLLRGGIACDVRLEPAGRPGGLWRHVARRLRYGMDHAARCLALRLAGFRSFDRPNADVLLYSRFPVLWEAGSEGERERMFADWPQALAARGHSVIFGAAFSGSLRQIVTSRSDLLARCRTNGIVLVEALASIRTLLSAHLDVAFFVRYVRWRRRQPAVVFNDIDVSPLFWRELDASATSTDVPFDRVLSATLGQFFDRAPRVSRVFLPFEYQPMERAVCLAARQRGRVVIGLQTGLYTSNQMGFMFPAAQVRDRLDDPTRSPLPDALAAYGELPYRVFAERLGSNRAFLAGPIRYARLAHAPREGREEVTRRHGLPAGTIVLVTTSTVMRESVHVLEAAFHAAATVPGVFLALKFHYHLVLHDHVVALVRRYPGVGHRIFESHLDDLLSVSAAIVCGGSSTGIEAIARGCMPLVFRSMGDVLPNPMLDVAGAAFFWQTPSELVQALSAVLAGDASCSARRAQWPAALRAQLSPLLPDMNANLYGILADHGLVRPSTPGLGGRG